MNMFEFLDRHNVEIYMSCKMLEGMGYNGKIGFYHSVMVSVQGIALNKSSGESVKYYGENLQGALENLCKNISNRPIFWFNDRKMRWEEINVDVTLGGFISAEHNMIATVRLINGKLKIQN